MYFIRWIENGSEKSYRADSWIERDSIVESLQSKGISAKVTIV